MAENQHQKFVKGIDVSFFFVCSAMILHEQSFFVLFCFVARFCSSNYNKKKNIEDFPMRKIKVFIRIYKSLLVVCRKDPFQYIYFVIISITSSALE